MGKLYPPMIESTLPAFYSSILKVPFTMNRSVSMSDFSNMQVIIKNIVSGTLVEEPIFAYSYSTSEAWFTVNSKNYQIGQFYKIQIAYVDNTNTVGYWSDVGIAKYTANLTESLSLVCTEDYVCIGQYTIPEADRLEKIYSYHFDLIDAQGKIRATSGEQLHNIETDDNNIQSDLWTLPVGLQPGDELSYVVTTTNNVRIGQRLSSLELPIPLSEDRLVDHDLKALFKAEMDNDLGEVKISIAPRPENVYSPEKDKYIAQSISGSFVLSRKTNQDNVWKEIKKFSLDGASDLLYKWIQVMNSDGSPKLDTNGTPIFITQETPIDLWRDRTIEAGVEYTYALQFFNNQGAYSTHILNIEGPQIANFEDAFLYDGDKQLCIKYNPKISSFKTVKMESKVNTIGGKYPFIFRNGDTEYKEFQISGLLSALSDPEGDFCELAAAGEPRDRTGSVAPTPPPAATNLTADNFRRERNFKLNVLDWLNDGKPKLFRSPGEGNYIIRIMNVSLSPIDTLGRMLHNFSCQAVEIQDYNWNNLIDRGYTKLNPTLNFDRNNIISGDFLYPLRDQYYDIYNPKSITIFVQSPYINMVEAYNLNQHNITNIKIEHLPIYHIQYKYEQFMFTTTNAIGEEEVRWGIKQVAPLGQPSFSKPGIYYIYGKTQNPQLFSISVPRKLTLAEFKTIVNAHDQTIIYNGLSAPTEQNTIIPISRMYQVNMTKYNAMETKSIDCIEDIYAIHLNPGLIATITYEESIVGGQ